VELLKEKANLIPNDGNVLVPGCGRGYDVFLLASPERKVVGLDLSETCIQQCLEVGMRAHQKKAMS
jgi:cyclopropane fatty-acyl-phospholipid synthase-like methyltransferase